MRVSEPLRGAAARRSRALPAATVECSSISRTAVTLARVASARAAAPPISPAPTMATSDIARSFYMGIAQRRVGEEIRVGEALEKGDQIVDFRLRDLKPANAIASERARVAAQG